jgi:hypothetical protein
MALLIQSGAFKPAVFLSAHTVAALPWLLGSNVVPTRNINTNDPSFHHSCHVSGTEGTGDGNGGQGSEDGKNRKL